MPWFFTHIRHGSDLFEDQHGQKFETVKDAVDDAIVAARQIMADACAPASVPLRARSS